MNVMSVKDSEVSGKHNFWCYPSTGAYLLQMKYSAIHLAASFLFNKKKYSVQLMIEDNQEFFQMHFEWKS